MRCPRSGRGGVRSRGLRWWGRRLRRERSSVTQGIVSSLGRTVPEGSGVVLPNAIQTSAANNPGNSGGALADIEGRVIGIPTLAAVDPELGGSQAPGIGFAIPSDTATSVATQLISHGRVTRSGRAS